MSVLRSLLCVALLAAPPAYAARASVPMLEFDDLPISTVDGNPLSSEQIRKAIVQAAAADEFVPAAQPGNKVKLIYTKRDYTLVVEVAFTPKSYSIKYVDSMNLGYGMEGGKQLIHPTVNRLLKNLRQRIDRQLNQL
jgi:hypothetical protein